MRSQGTVRQEASRRDENGDRPRGGVDSLREGPANMALAFVAVSLALVLLLGMVGCIELGRRASRRYRARHPQEGEAPTGAMDAAVFALFGLLLAFTFSGAAGRLDDRRALVVQEANAVGTAWLRLDLLPPAAQAELRPLFRAYVEARLAAYRAVPDMVAVQAALDRATALQARLWRGSMEAARSDGNPGVISLMGASLNEMIDITTTRQAATMMHPPLAVFLLLFGMGLAASLVAGFSLGRSEVRSWLHVLVYAGAIAASVYVILDMEFPRFGLIQVDDFDRLLTEVLAGMK
jgi:hypothetical protein